MVYFNYNKGKGFAGIFFVVVFFLFCFFCEKSFAQENIGIPTGVQVSPARFDWDLEKGVEKTGVINLKNFSDKKFEVQVEVEDFFVSDESTEAKFFVPNEGHPLYAYDVVNWIEIPKEIVLLPGEGKDILFKVSVPDNTPTGGYYGAVFFKTSAHEVEDGSGSGAKLFVNQRVGVLLVMAIQGEEEINRNGFVREFFPRKKVFINNPASFIAKIENTGNLHYKAFGKIDIFKFGEKVDTIELIPRVIYPQKIRKYERNWDFSAWSHGFYTAKIELFSEDKQIALTDELSFWLIPWKSTCALILLVIIIWLIFRIFTSKFEIQLKTKKNKKNKSDVFCESELSEKGLISKMDNREVLDGDATKK